MRGGRLVGEQVRIAEANLHQARDYPVLTDYRALFGGLFQRMYGLTPARLQTVFPADEPERPATGLTAAAGRPVSADRLKSLDDSPVRSYICGMDIDVSAPARGRPREFDVDAALTAALKVFWQQGYDATSLTDLTEAMGVSRPSLYAAFGNKESLYRKALDLYEREKLAYVQRALAAPTARGVAETLL